MRIIITGAASGIGLATAHLLHSKGETVYLWDVQAEKLKSTAELIKAEYSLVDVSDSDAVANAMKTASEKMGGVDAIIHCAGIARVGLFEDLPIEEHRRVVEINLMGTLNIAHAAIPYLKQAKGSLILLASSSSYYGPPDFASYGATKGAVVRLSEALRLEWERYNVHLGIVIPHFVTTPMLDESRKSAMFDGAKFTNSPEEVAQKIEVMLRKRTNVAVPNLMNKLNYFLSRHLPELGPFLVRMIWNQGKKMRGRK